MNIYFFIPDHAIYDDTAIYLAEGLRALGLNIYCNRDYWKLDINDSFLFNHNPNVSHHDCDLVIITYAWFSYLDPNSYVLKSLPFPNEFFIENRKYITVYLDLTDGYKTSSWRPAFREFDLILRGKYNSKTQNPSNARPWVHGFTSRVLQAIGDIDFSSKENVALQNFGFSHTYMHSCRVRAIRDFIPLINTKIKVESRKSSGSYQKFDAFSSLMWHQTEGKHDPEYYKMLAQSAGMFCFCGDLVPGLPADPSQYLVGGKKAILKKHFWYLISKIFKQKERIIQWDSWRFWESLVAGCVPIHINLDSYGALLPVMPEDGIHYIGIDFDDLPKSQKRFLELWEKNVEIGITGRKWAIDHYHPTASAIRFLELVSNHKNRAV